MLVINQPVNFLSQHVLHYYLSLPTSAGFYKIENLKTTADFLKMQFMFNKTGLVHINITSTISFESHLLASKFLSIIQKLFKREISAIRIP